MTTTASASGRFFNACKLLFLIIQAWLFNGLIILDLAGNWLIGGAPTETISSRLGKGQIADKPVHAVAARFVDRLFYALFRQQDHCLKSIQRGTGEMALSEVIDRHRRGLPPVWKV